MRKQLLLTLFTVMALTVTAQKYVGGDISLLTQYENAGAIYKDKNGNAVSNLISYYKSIGLNSMRIRLFVDPSKASDDEKKAGAIQDLDYVIALGKRIKNAGMTLVLDFHYSDTWADPSNQWTPDAWKSLGDTELYSEIYNYTKNCLNKLKEEEVTPDFIQIGNEISYGMLWGAKGTSSPKKCYTNSSANWGRFVNLLKKANEACKEVCPDAKTIIHSERAAQLSVLTAFLDKISEVNYDIIGLSYYPDYHKDLATLETTLTKLESQYSSKKIMIVETGYSYSWALDNATYDYTGTYPYTEEGQRKFTADLVTMLNKHNNVIGLYWWFPEDNEYNIVYKNGSADWSKQLRGFWNAALYDHTTGKPYAALFELPNFNPNSSGISSLKYAAPEDNIWYDLSGKRMTNKPTSKGIYINNGRKVIVK